MERATFLVFSEWKPGTGHISKQGGGHCKNSSRRACHGTRKRDSAGERRLVTGLSRDLDKPGDSGSLPVGFERQAPSWLQPRPGGRTSGALLLPKHPPARPVSPASDTTGRPRCQEGVQSPEQGAAMGRGRRREGGTGREPLSQADSQASLFQGETVRIKRLESFWKNLGKTPDRRKG